MLKRNAAVLLVAALVLGVAGWSWAQEPEGPTVTDEQAQPAADRDKPRHRGPGGALLRRAVHAEVLVETDDGGFETLTLDRGTVSAVDEGSVTVERADGEQVTKTLTDETRFGPERTAADVEEGRQAVVISDGDNARAVLQRPEDGERRRGPRPGNNRAAPGVLN